MHFVECESDRKLPEWKCGSSGSRQRQNHSECGVSPRGLFEFSISFKFQWGDRFMVRRDGKEDHLLETAISSNLAI
jgi:hypothetical protein